MSVSCKSDKFNAPTYHATFHTSDLDDWLRISRHILLGLETLSNLPVSKLGTWLLVYSWTNQGAEGGHIALCSAKRRQNHHPLNRAFVPIPLKALSGAGRKVSACGRVLNRLKGPPTYTDFSVGDSLVATTQNLECAYISITCSWYQIKTASSGRLSLLNPELECLKSSMNHTQVISEALAPNVCSKLATSIDLRDYFQVFSDTCRE